LKNIKKGRSPSYAPRYQYINNSTNRQSRQPNIKKVMSAMAAKKAITINACLVASFM